MDALVSMIAAREVSRKYLALAHKPWTYPVERTVAAPIGRDPRNRLRMAVVDLAVHAGKAARTDIRLLESADSGVGSNALCIRGAPIRFASTWLP